MSRPIQPLPRPRLAPWPRLAAALACALATALPAQAADSHALLMSIGHYGRPELDLPGIALDAARARQMAQAMGFGPADQVALSDDQLTLRGMAQALEALDRRVAPGDRVFIYFSGHGKQIDGSRFGARCSEGLVTRDGALYLDAAIEYTLHRLADKAAQVVMMNDSCHSGGAATKRFMLPGDADDEGVAKAYPAPVTVPQASALAGAAGICGVAVNKGLDADTWSRAFGRMAADRWLYIAAARTDEVAFATARGSRATQAWQACLESTSADADRDGQISGDELRRCAQHQIDSSGPGRQTITLEGNIGLPLRPTGRPTGRR